MTSRAAAATAKFRTSSKHPHCSSTTPDNSRDHSRVLGGKRVHRKRRRRLPRHAAGNPIPAHPHTPRRRHRGPDRNRPIRSTPQRGNTMNTAMTEGKTVRAIVIDQPGPPETLQIGQIKHPEPQPDSLLVDVHAAGVNFADILERDGTYPVSFPFVPGREGVGVVRETGTAVSEFTVGDRVAWTTVGASYAEQVIVPEAAAVAVPGALTDEQALSVAQGLSAHYLATSAYPAAVGDSVLVHAAAGGVGSLLTQILAIRGVRVLATVSTSQKAEIARAAGAADVLVLGEMADADLIRAVRRLTDGRGVSAVYD